MIGSKNFILVKYARKSSQRTQETNLVPISSHELNLINIFGSDESYMAQVTFLKLKLIVIN